MPVLECLFTHTSMRVLLRHSRHILIRPCHAVTVSETQKNRAPPRPKMTAASKPALHRQRAGVKAPVTPQVSEFAGHGMQMLLPDGDWAWKVSAAQGMQIVPRSVALTHSLSPAASREVQVRPAASAAPLTHAKGSFLGRHIKLAPQYEVALPWHYLPSLSQTPPRRRH